jgi:hypothetical protein
MAIQQGRRIMPRKVRNILWISAASGLMAMALGIAGCSETSPSNLPVDCDVVKTQVQAGQTDAQIAANLNTTPDKVAACHGPERGGNSNTLIPEKGY